MKKFFGLILIITIPLSISFLLYAFDLPKSNKGYLAHKYVDTVEITGKHVSENLYALTFNLVYQDSTSQIQKIKRVSYQEYNLSEVNTEQAITYTID